jgi:hypothetical protein
VGVRRGEWVFGGGKEGAGKHRKREGGKGRGMERGGARRGTEKGYINRHRNFWDRHTATNTNMRKSMGFCLVMLYFTWA